MGHIIVSEELDPLEKPSETAAPAPIPSSSSPSVPTSSPRQKSPTGSYGGSSNPNARPQQYLPRKCQGSWNECVQAVSGLLPPPYSERWLRCLQQLLHNEGPLPESWRIYIAILALCRHEVTWAVRVLMLEFISVEGDRTWLSGLQFAPLKLRALSQINKILAHRPWILTSQHIQDLTKGEESWSISELCQALCLMTHFHSFASFLHACLPLPPFSHTNSLPLTPRTSPCKALLSSSLPNTLKHSSSPTDLPSDASVTSVANAKSASDESTNGTVLTSISPARNATAVTPKSGILPESSSQNGDSTSLAPITSPPSVPKTLEQNGSNNCSNKIQGSPNPVGAKREIQASPQPSKQSKNDSNATRSKPETYFLLREYSHLCHDISYTYEDFPCKAPANIFKIWEFNWQEHGYSLMTRLLNEMGNIIDERFGAVKSVTHALWDRNKDNSFHYRKAVWNYIQSLYGIHHEDYLYSQIDNILTPEIKTFIKKCCCWPELLEGKIPADLLCSTDNVPSQLVPLSIIIMEARMESELLYALRAIIPHQC